MKTRTIARDSAAFVLAQFACFAAAGLGSAFTATSVRTWYQEIAKPAWTPPDWLFGPVWTTLFFLMGLSAWLVWRSGGWSGARWPLLAFGAQLVLNAVWSIVFFGLQRPGLAFGEILLLWCAIVVTIVLFWRHSRTAAILLMPYLGWSSFAAFLNFTIWQMN